MVVFDEEVEHAPLRRTSVLAQMWVPSGLPSRSASRRAMVETERMFHSTDGAGVPPARQIFPRGVVSGMLVLAD